MKRKVLISMLAAMIFVIGCEKDDSGIDKLKKLDIVNASSLFITSDNFLKSSSTKSSFDGGKLFKITDAGYVEEVKYYDEKGNEISVTYYPNAIYNVCDNYVIVVFDNDAIGYLVRKHDGAVFSINEAVPSRYLIDYSKMKVLQMDAQGRSYFRAHGEEQIVVSKVNFDNPESITVQRVSPTNEQVGYFTINHEGSVIYYGFVGGDANVSVHRIITPTGSLINIPYDVVNESVFWQGIDGEIYYLMSAADEQYQVVKFTIDNNALNQENYGNPDDLGSLYWWGLGQAVKLPLQNKLYIINRDEVFEVFNPSSQPFKVEGLGMNSIKYGAASYYYYYIAGNNEAFQPALKKVNANNNIAEDILSPGEYDVYNMIVTENDIVTFTGVRMSDGKRVIGEIDNTGNLTIVDEELDSEVIVFERIN